MIALIPSLIPAHDRAQSPLIALLREMTDAGVKVTPLGVLHHALERGVDEEAAKAWSDQIARDQAQRERASR